MSMTVAVTKPTLNSPCIRTCYLLPGILIFLVVSTQSRSRCLPIFFLFMNFFLIIKQVGSAISVDIIKFEASLKEAILRVKESGLVKLWSALTLLSCYKDKRCAIYVIQVSPYLLSLGADSRQWKINEKEVTS